MTVAPAHRRTGMRHVGLDRVAVGTAAVAVVLVATGMTALGIIGFDASDEDFAGWRGVVVGVGVLGGALVSLTAFALAVVAKLLHEHWVWLWLPLLFGPVYVLSFPLWFE